MDLYTETSYATSKMLTLRYSTSFSESSKLFSKAIRPHIFAIYGLVRIADEIVDTYKGSDTETLLNNLENDVYAALKSHYSPNPIVHAFVTTARQFTIPKAFLTAFFTSMRMDLTMKTYTQAEYEKYIYGSAEVIGLMCLKVFCFENEKLYDKLAPSAQALGSAYQKVNFLRDIRVDYHESGRVYFPGLTFETFNDEQKVKIIADIKKDFKKARYAINKLPKSSRDAVTLSYVYYTKLLQKLQKSSAETIKTARVRVSNIAKFGLLINSRLEGWFR